MTKTETTAIDGAKSEVPMTLKNFKTNSDVENFYRFVTQNGLRTEALGLIQAIIGKTKKTKSRKRKSKKKILQ